MAMVLVPVRYATEAGVPGFQPCPLCTAFDTPGKPETAEPPTVITTAAAQLLDTSWTASLALVK